MKWIPGLSRGGKKLGLFEQVLCHSYPFLRTPVTISKAGKFTDQGRADRGGPGLFSAPPTSHPVFFSNRFLWVSPDLVPAPNPSTDTPLPILRVLQLRMKVCTIIN